MALPWLKWLPWRYIVRRIARAQGFLDPIALLSQFHRFAQPSEVAEPIELLRAGAVLHARGLINSRVIQHNLDWIWPYWVNRQFDPGDDAFVPRAFSLTHINLTHRNWTAVGVPDRSDYPIVDPRGLVTPFLDEWSYDAWILTDDGRFLAPSQSATTTQRMVLDRGVAIETKTEENGLALTSMTEMVIEKGTAICRTRVTAEADGKGSLVISLRPYNPEGVSFIHDVALARDHRRWEINRKRALHLSEAPDRHHIATYREGDVYIHLRDRDDQESGECDVGMATAAALFALEPGQSRTIDVDASYDDGDPTAAAAPAGWKQALSGHCALEVPDARYQALYDIALRTLVLHSPDDVYPGPYTYRRFWFRDAAFIINALLCAGFAGRAEKALDRFPSRQTAFGYYHSQDGEWDSNGEALWILERYSQLTGRPPKPEWARSIEHGARWIIRKRVSESVDAPHAGLLPAGFSAEHLGPNDFYYWDDFWGVAGLEAAAALMDRLGNPKAAVEFRDGAENFLRAIERSLEADRKRLGRDAIPASPYRRFDAGAIGSVVCGYPLQIFAEDDPRLLDTAAFLLDKCFFRNGFFQDMIHSGINAYLTLHVAQVLMRAGDRRCFPLIEAVVQSASPTGQWPEAIHPRTGGGCMGDGQHVWAAAEWIVMMRNSFVREEGDRLVLAAGISPDWLGSGARCSLGPAPTAFGNVSVAVEPEAGDEGFRVSWVADWRKKPEAVEVRLPGYDAVSADPQKGSVVLKGEPRP